MVGIYRITSPSGRIYIGQSWDIDRRWRDYRSSKGGSQRKVKSSFSKYGVDNHKFEMLQELPDTITQKYLDEMEILFIAQYRECGYRMMNIHPGGKGGKLPDEIKEEISKARKGTHLSEESLKSRREKMKGYRHSVKTREKMSESRKKWKRSKESIRKTAEWHTGRKRTEATKQKLRECGRAVNRDINYRNKMSESLKTFWKNNTIMHSCEKCSYQHKNKGVIQRWHNNNCRAC